MLIRAVMLAGLTATTAGASPYTDLIVFGDSLSDVGNVLANPFVDSLLPIDDYQNRFSNGPVYSEHLSEGLGLGALTRSETGGDNFANGGAETDGPTSFFEGATFIDSLVEQVDTYLARIGSTAPDPQTLFVVFIGANDLPADASDVSTPASVVAAQMDRLVNAGAQQFLGINLPLLGSTPRFASTTSSVTMTTQTAAYNAALDTVWDDLETENPAVSVHRLDVSGLFADLLDNAAQYGLTNTTGIGQDVPGSSFDRAPGYVFWDDVHPTREVHQLLGEAAVRAVLPNADYDRDGILTAQADYTAWSDDYGSRFGAIDNLTPSLAADGNGDGRIDAADYTLWRDAVSQAIPTAIPEPSSSIVLLVTIFSALSRKQRAKN